MDLVFDQVCIADADNVEYLEPEQFIKKPVHLRVQYIMEKKVSFLKDGEEVDSKAALANYRKWSALKGAMMQTRL